MSTTHVNEVPNQAPSAEAVEEFADKLFTDLVGTLNVFATSIGVERGWYEALAGTDSMNPAELAAATSTDTRCAQEWICCLPDDRNASESVATGTVMRKPTFERYATEAGFSAVEVLPIDNDFFRFYQLAH